MHTLLGLSLSADSPNEINQSLAGLNARPKSRSVWPSLSLSGRHSHCLPAHLSHSYPMNFPASQTAIFELDLYSCAFSSNCVSYCNPLWIYHDFDNRMASFSGLPIAVIQDYITINILESLKTFSDRELI